RCSVRLPEREAALVGERLQALEPEWPAMSAAARQAYDEWFAPEAWFGRAVEQCGELLESGVLGLRRQWTDTRLWRERMRRRLAGARPAAPSSPAPTPGAPSGP